MEQGFKKLFDTILAASQVFGVSAAIVVAMMVFV